MVNSPLIRPYFLGGGGIGGGTLGSHDTDLCFESSGSFPKNGSTHDKYLQIIGHPLHIRHTVPSSPFLKALCGTGFSWK